VLILVLSALALAGGDGLYDPAPPLDGAFVRFVATPGASGPIQVAGRGVGTLEAASVGPYVVAQEGERTLQLGSRSTELNVLAGHFYTVVPAGDSLRVLEDTANTNLAKASLALYNLTERPALALKTADGALAVVQDVAPTAVGARAVNPIRVELGVFDGATSVSALEPLSLAQGQSYAIFALQDGDAVRTLVVQARTDTTR